MAVVSSTGFSLCGFDLCPAQRKPTEKSAQAEACATGPWRACAVTARGKPGRKLSQSSCEKCGLGGRSENLEIGIVRVEGRVEEPNTTVLNVAFSGLFVLPRVF
jgi:hypothetical protein